MTFDTLFLNYVNCVFSDPVKKWKAAQDKLENATMSDTPEDSEDSDAEENAKDNDYDYLLGKV